MVVIVVGLSLGGEPYSFATIGVEVFPLIALAGFNQLGYRWRAFYWVGWIWFWLLLLLFGSLLFAAVVAALPGASSQGQRPEALGTLLVMMLGAIVLVALAAARGWTRPVRWLGGRPDPDSAPQSQASLGLAYFVLGAITSLVALHGQPLLLQMLQTSPSMDQALADQSATSQILELYYELAWVIPFGLLAVGYPIRRSFPQALERLGYQRLAWRIVPLCVLFAAALIALSFGLDTALQPLWAWTGWPLTNQDLVRKLFGQPMNSVPGAVSAALEAGLAEELVFRGVFQPRTGWLLANLAFAGAHAFQYGPDGLLSVFVVGAVQAAIRARWNTSAAALTHGSYDLLLILGALANLPGF